MTADGDSVTRLAPLLPSYLSENMKVGRLVEVLEQLPFNSRQEGRLVLDRIARNFCSTRPEPLLLIRNKQFTT